MRFTIKNIKATELYCSAPPSALISINQNLMIQLARRSKVLQESPIVIFGALASQCKDVIKLNSGSPGHGPIAEVSQAVKKTTAFGISTYKTHPYGSFQARVNASKYYEQRYGIYFDPVSQINVTTGFTHLFKSICETLINPGNLVALANPVFPQYLQPIKLAGGDIVYFKSEEEDEWKPNLEDVRKVLRKNVRIIVLNYPNNPTGATLSENDWNNLIEDCFIPEIQRRRRAGEEDFIVVLDDAYVPLYHQSPKNKGQKHQPTYGAVLHKRIRHCEKDDRDLSEGLNQLMQNSIIACSLSKEGMAGILCGMGASKNEELIRALRIPGKSSVISVSTFGETALESVVYSNGKTLEWAGHLYSKRINQLADGLIKIAKKYYSHDIFKNDKIVNYVPSSGMYVCANFSELIGRSLKQIQIDRIYDCLESNHLSSEDYFNGGKFRSNFDIALWFLFEVGVAVVPIGEPESGYLRFSVGLPQAIKEDSFGCIQQSATEQEGTRLIDLALQRIDMGLHKINTETRCFNMSFSHKIEIKKSTQVDIANHFFGLAETGFDVQEFDPHAFYGGTKKSLKSQKGYYKDFEIERIHKLAHDLKAILEANHENEFLDFLTGCQQYLMSSTSPKNLSYIQVAQLLPKTFFEEIEPEHMVAPNGLRIPESLVEFEQILRYSAKLLVPKLLLASINGLQGMVPWTDVDMDLNSTVHAMRPDPGKNEVNSGYGGGSILPHTDGYWNVKENVPLCVLVIAVANPFREPTSFIPVQSIFRILSSSHALYSEWVDVFRDLLRPSQTPDEFVRWVVSEALKPQFSFVMGKIGGDASRGVYETPLLEYSPRIDKYLFRAKSTFIAKNEEVRPVVYFVNRMLEYLSKSQQFDSYHEQVLEPGEAYFALNGSDLQVNLEAVYGNDDVAYPVTGLGCVHGRSKLNSQSGHIARTLVRGNCLLPSQDFFLNANYELLSFDNFNHTINNALLSGFRFNKHCR